MRKMLLAALCVGVLGLFWAAPAVAADYPPSCTTGSTDPSCTPTNTNGDPTLYVAGASGQGAASGQGNLAFTGSHDTFPLALVGIGAVVVGGAFVFASRRRFAHRA